MDKQGWSTYNWGYNPLTILTHRLLTSNSTRLTPYISVGILNHNVINIFCIYLTISYITYIYIYIYKYIFELPCSSMNSHGGGPAGNAKNFDVESLRSNHLHTDRSGGPGGRCWGTRRFAKVRSGFIVLCWLVLYFG